MIGRSARRSGSGWADGYGLAKRWVEPGRAVWISGGQLWSWAGGEPELIAERAVYAAIEGGWRVWVDDARAVWALAPGASTDEALRIAVTDGGPPVLRGGWIWGLEDTVPWKRRLDGPSTVYLRDLSRCVEVHGDGPDGVAICVTNAAPAAVMYLPDTGEPRLVAEGAYVTGARLEQGAVWWGTWDDPDAWCDAYVDGTVFRASLGQDGQPGAVEPIAVAGSGCHCCGAIWPAFSIAVEGEVAAWNYAGGRGEAAIGIARAVCE